MKARFTIAQLTRVFRDAKADGRKWAVEIPNGANPQIRTIFFDDPANDTQQQQVQHFPANNGWVYFIRAVQTGRIKIGFSSSPERRLKELEYGCPEDLELVTKIPGSFFREHDLHRQFAAHRARGEWFEPAPELLAYIAELLGK